MNDNQVLIDQLNVLVEEELVALTEGNVAVAVSLQDKAIKLIEELGVSKVSQPSFWNPNYQSMLLVIEDKIKLNMLTLDTLKLRATDELNLIKLALEKLAEIKIS
jgi:hypothetical protein